MQTIQKPGPFFHSLDEIKQILHQKNTLKQMERHSNLLLVFLALIAGRRSVDFR
jgi:hypothetical protein